MRPWLREPSETRSFLLAGAIVALTAFLPVAKGLLAGHSFYFRDLAAQFFPVRRFLVAGLRSGELRFWNPFTHEGEPSSLLPLGYPFDLLQALWPSEHGLSVLLALHLPLAALAFMALARGLGLSAVAAAGGGLVYALGGFSLSSLNLYVYLQAMAWAPFVVLGLVKTAAGSRQHCARAAVFLALCLSTTGIEVTLQAVVLGVVLAWPRTGAGGIRAFGTIALGFALSAAVLVPTVFLVEGSARAAGFTTEVVLAHSVHPFTLLQTFIAGLYGDLASLPDHFWGQNFFPRGFPYILSLYLGALALSLAVVGLRERSPLATRVAALGGLAIIACLGRFAGLGPLVDMLPMLHKIRFPTKAFFTVHASVALLTAFGLHALASGSGRPWRRLARLTAAGGAVLLVAAVTLQAGATPPSLLAHVFPPDLPVPLRLEAAHRIARDAAVSAAVLLSAAALALVVRSGRTAARGAALALVALVAVDLVQAGAGLNAMVSPTFYRVSSAAEKLAETIRGEGGRVFTFDPTFSETYRRARSDRTSQHEIWTFRVLQDTFTPEFNVVPGIPTAMSLDRTMLVPMDRVLPPTLAQARFFPLLVDKLRSAGVRHVLAVEPIAHPDLEPVSLESSPDLWPLVVHAYRLRGALPLRSVEPELEVPGESTTRPEPAQILRAAETSDRITLEVRTTRPSLLVIRDAWAPGWRAWLNGGEAPIGKANGRHRSIALPAGASRIVMEYSPPGWVTGVGISVAAALLTAFMGRPRAGPPERSTEAHG